MKPLLAILFIFISADVYSQDLSNSKFNILKYDLNLDIYNCFLKPYPRSFMGNEIITVRAGTQVGQVSLNAENNSLTIDSVSVSGNSFSHQNNLLLINLDRFYDSSEVFDIKIYYKHKDIYDSSFIVRDGIVYTDNEPVGARKWFPCNDVPSDKAMLEMTTKVPKDVVLCGNGMLADSSISGDTLTYKWISTKPIATYLVCIAGKVRFNLDVTYWNRPSDNEKVPLRFYWQAGETVFNINNVKTKTPMMLDLYSKLFGEYPFEKLAYATTNKDFQWGGMENQTLITLCPDCWTEDLACHEIAHQWFGDLITPLRWSDIWLNEGFAVYCEALWAEYQRGSKGYKSVIAYEAEKYFRANPGRALYDKEWDVNVPHDSILFSVPMIYSKAAGVVYMLRYVLGDSIFFNTLYLYTNNPEFMYGNITTSEFTNFVSIVTQRNMNWFFDEWLYQPNHPVYQNQSSIEDLNNGKWRVDYTINQIQTNAPFFKMPVELKVVFENGTDILMKVDNEYNVQKFSFEFDNEPKRISFDPNNQIILKEVVK